MTLLKDEHIAPDLRLVLQENGSLGFFTYSYLGHLLLVEKTHEGSVEAQLALRPGDALTLLAWLEQNRDELVRLSHTPVDTDKSLGRAPGEEETP